MPGWSAVLYSKWNWPYRIIFPCTENSDQALKQFKSNKKFADRRKKVVSARTYFYQDENKCDVHLETFLKCSDAAGKLKKIMITKYWPYRLTVTVSNSVHSLLWMVNMILTIVWKPGLCTNQLRFTIEAPKTSSCMPLWVINRISIISWLFWIALLMIGIAESCN